MNVGEPRSEAKRTPLDGADPRGMESLRSRRARLSRLTDRQAHPPPLSLTNGKKEGPVMNTEHS
jgi:hypothetical protein